MARESRSVTVSKILAALQRDKLQQTHRHDEERESIVKSRLCGRELTINYTLTHPPHSESRETMVISHQLYDGEAAITLTSKRLSAFAMSGLERNIKRMPPSEVEDLNKIAATIKLLVDRRPSKK